MTDLMLDARNVKKAFGAHVVLQDLTVAVPTGQVACLLGPSGSGKSTFLRCINHLEQIDGGTIRVDGNLVGYQQDGERLRELAEREISRARSTIGMVFQSFNLFPQMTALENITEGPVRVKRQPKAQALARAEELLAQVGLTGRGGSYPAQLSGGQQQRVAIARALAMDPKLILFDEPTSALDPELTGDVIDVMRDLATTGTTMIVATHEMGFVRDTADQVFFMDEGLLVEQGTPEEVFTDAKHERTRRFLARALAM